MLTATALVAYAMACHIALPPETVAWRVTRHTAVESGGDPFTINDNTTHQSYRPATREAAIELARRLLAAGHSLDGGAMNVNSQHWQRLFGGDIARVFDPQANVCAGMTVVAEAYDYIERRVSCIYVSGKPDCPPQAARYPDLIGPAPGNPTKASAPVKSSSLGMKKGSTHILVFSGD